MLNSVDGGSSFILLLLPATVVGSCARETLSNRRDMVSFRVTGNMFSSFWSMSLMAIDDGNGTGMSSGSGTGCEIVSSGSAGNGIEAFTACCCPFCAFSFFTMAIFLARRDCLLAASDISDTILYYTTLYNRPIKHNMHLTTTFNDDPPQTSIRYQHYVLCVCLCV
jgi:hypothetical protein